MPLRTRLSQLMRSILASAGMCDSARRDVARSPARRVGGAGDRAADDQDRGAVVERLARRHDALLVGDVGAGRADAGNDEEAVRPGARAPRRPPRRSRRCRRGRPRAPARRAARPGRRARRSTPIAARSLASRLVSTVTATTLVPAGAAALAASSIARPPAAWTVRIAGSSGASACDRLGDGVGNVVELQVEEDRQAELGDPQRRRRGRWRRRIRGRASRRRRWPRTSRAMRRPRGRGPACRWRRRSASYRPAPRRRRRARRQRRRRGWRSSASSRRPMRPDPRAHDQPGRQEAEQEDDQQQDRQLDVGLDVAPQVERHVVPVAAGEQARRAPRAGPRTGSSGIAWRRV